MSIIPLLILATLALALCALGGFIWAVRAGQFDDTCTPSMRILTDDQAQTKRSLPKESQHHKSS